jgi:hypothetical protein
MQKFTLCKNPLRLRPALPAPTARPGPEVLHSQPVLHNALGSLSQVKHRLAYHRAYGNWRTASLIPMPFSFSARRPHNDRDRAWAARRSHPEPTDMRINGTQ